ncbi:SH3 domain-containing protein [Flavobacterium sp. RSB2_4_14]|uniref:SH3 domain-containing protein n=1 Tax=Flavobacterium sp. RSB2_4_14 TaxID=3447665 RepID=UPI003F31F28D
MNKGTLLIISLLVYNSLLSQSYLGTITKQVNFRQGPATDYGVISSLKSGTQIFIISLEMENDFYNIIDIETDKEGYIHKSFVKIGDIVEKNDRGMFTPSGKTSNYYPEIEIFNNTSLTLTLKLNSETYTFSPKQKRTITLSPGTYNYRASAPSVIPNVGTEYMESNMGYTWQFYIVTERR